MKRFFTLCLCLTALFFLSGSLYAASETAMPEMKNKTANAVKTVQKVAQKININKADAKTLQTLPGIGEKTAQKIIEQRKKKPFMNKEELLKVKGIGEKTLEKIAELITFQ